MPEPPPHAPFQFTRTVTEPRSGEASLAYREDRVILRVDTPGFDPATAQVRVTKQDGERHLVVSTEEKDGAGTSRRSVHVRLRPDLGSPLSQAQFAHGVMTVEFERVPQAEEPDIPVAVQK